MNIVTFFSRARRRRARVAHQHDATEAIIDCREFNADVVRQMIAEGQIRDANTLSIWAPTGSVRRDFS